MYQSTRGYKHVLLQLNFARLLLSLCSEHTMKEARCRCDLVAVTFWSPAFESASFFPCSFWVLLAKAATWQLSIIIVVKVHLRRVLLALCYSVWRRKHGKGIRQRAKVREETQFYCISLNLPIATKGRWRHPRFTGRRLRFRKVRQLSWSYMLWMASLRLQTQVLSDLPCLLLSRANGDCGRDVACYPTHD